MCIDIKGEIISGIRPFSGNIVEENTILDARGSTVMPGIINAHTHIARGGKFQANDSVSIPQVMHNLRAMLLAGVTTVGDMGCGGGFIHSLRSHTDRNPEAGPSIRAAGPMLTATDGYPLDWLPTWMAKLGVAFTCDSESEARRAVQRVVNMGMDHVKLMIMHKSYAEKPLPALKGPVAQAIVDEAHHLGLRALAHVHWLEDYRMALDVGVDAIMHSCFEPLDEGMVKRVADSGIPVCATLFIYESGLRGAEERFDLNVGYTRLVSRKIQKDWHYYSEAYATSGDLVPPVVVGSMPKARAAWGVGNTARNLSLLRDAGVPIAFGTDANYGFCTLARPVDELRSMQRAGLSLQECLRAATSNAASLLGCMDRGILEPGKRADIIVADGDIKEDADALEQMRDVIVAGCLLEDVPAQRGMLALKTASALTWGFVQSGYWTLTGR